MSKEITIIWTKNLKRDYVETYFNCYKYYNCEDTIFAIIENYCVVGFDSGATVHRSEYTRQLDDDGDGFLPIYEMRNEDVGELGEFEDCPADLPLELKLDCFEDFRWAEIVEAAIDELNFGIALAA